MARDINKSLANLKMRRSGEQRIVGTRRLAEAAHDFAEPLTEAWEKRATNAPNTKFALGAMQEVDSRYTAISVETSERVGNQLKRGFKAESRIVETRLQGSVPLNVHIRGYSDVDLLVLPSWYRMYDTTGILAQQSGRYFPSNDDPKDTLRYVRNTSARILEDNFPGTDLDTSGGKALKISGASLPRSVDVVPGLWWDTGDYQRFQAEAYRGIAIYDFNVSAMIYNLPFLHITRVHQRDADLAKGGLKKAIRLCKNVKAEANEDNKNINLSSFDIAGLMYHANQAAFAVGVVYELAILAETQRFLEYLSENYSEAIKLKVPDETRAVIDTTDKFGSLVRLSAEIRELAIEVGKEQQQALRLYSTAPVEEVRRVLQNAFVL